MKNEGIEVFIASLKHIKDQHEYLVKLRLNGFLLCPLQFVKEHIPNFKRQSNWQYFVRVLKFNKAQPHKDRFDFSLIFAVKYAFGRVNYIKIYAENELYKVQRMPWPEKVKTQGNFKKPKRLVEFPAEMTYDERRIWRDEYQKHYLFPKKYIASEFYLHWKDQIIWVNQKAYNKRLKALKLNYAQ